MINIKGIFQPKIGDKVTIKSNQGNHTYVMGKEYEIINDNGMGNYLLGEVDGFVPANDPNHQLMYQNQSWISLVDLDIKGDKGQLISNFTDMLEFLKDYEWELNNCVKLEKEFKVYHILKEVKSGKTDFEKIDIISKYL